jgi:hypothetical protein
MEKFFGDLVKKEADDADAAKKKLSVRFLLGQQEIMADESDPSKAAAVRFRRHRLVGQGIEPVEEGTKGADVTIPAGLIITSIGQRSTPLMGEEGADWFDTKTNRLKHEAGRVLPELAGPGLYCAGWVKTGPKGVIGDSRDCAGESTATLLADAKAGLLPAIEEGFDGGIEKIAADLTSGGLTAPVRWDGWRRIEHAEEVNGLLDGGKIPFTPSSSTTLTTSTTHSTSLTSPSPPPGKIREKMVSVEQMVATANDHSYGGLGEKMVSAGALPPNLPYMVVTIELQAKVQYSSIHHTLYTHTTHPTRSWLRSLRREVYRGRRSSRRWRA